MKWCVFCPKFRLLTCRGIPAGLAVQALVRLRFGRETMPGGRFEDSMGSGRDLPVG